MRSASLPRWSDYARGRWGCCRERRFSPSPGAVDGVCPSPRRAGRRWREAPDEGLLIPFVLQLLLDLPPEARRFAHPPNVVDRERDDQRDEDGGFNGARGHGLSVEQSHIPALRVLQPGEEHRPRAL